jgi:hypothetical protein
MRTNSDVVRRAFESLLIQSRTHRERSPMIAAIAARAGVSRSSIYRFHPGVVAQIRALNGEHDSRKQDQLRVKAQLLATQLRSEKELTRALARSCAELAAEKAATKGVRGREVEPTTAPAAHCTGWRALGQLAQRFGDRVVASAVGKRFVL